MEFNLTLTKVVTPTADGNDKAADPMQFDIRALTNEERNRCTSMIVSDGEVKVQPNLPQFFRLGVTAIRGCRVGGADIRTAEEFLALPILFNTYIEVASAVASYSGLKEETERKN